MKRAFALPHRPNAKEMQALAEAWRPWRAVAARVLWTYYRTVAMGKGRANTAPERPVNANAESLPKPPARQRARS